MEMKLQQSIRSAHEVVDGDIADFSLTSTRLHGSIPFQQSCLLWDHAWLSLAAHFLNPRSFLLTSGALWLA
ncbi:hypothetical protein CLAIMM_08521 [Cladophialophora immunda]|nr:hypothetical protein CLAIMM_08521 [Cladophialophora immunda]